MDTHEHAEQIRAMRIPVLVWWEDDRLKSGAPGKDNLGPGYMVQVGSEWPHALKGDERTGQEPVDPSIKQPPEILRELALGAAFWEGLAFHKEDNYVVTIIEDPETFQDYTLIVEGDDGEGVVEFTIIGPRALPFFKGKKIMGCEWRESFTSSPYIAVTDYLHPEVKGQELLDKLKEQGYPRIDPWGYFPRPEEGWKL